MSPFDKIITYTIEAAEKRERERIVRIIGETRTDVLGGPELKDRIIEAIERQRVAA